MSLWELLMKYLVPQKTVPEVNFPDYRPKELEDYLLEVQKGIPQEKNLQMLYEKNLPRVVPIPRNGGGFVRG